MTWILAVALAIAILAALHYRSQAIGWRECAEAVAQVSEASDELSYCYEDLRTAQMRSQFESECV